MTMGATTDQIAALTALILSLVGTGVSLFIWMAVAGWNDKAGVGAAVIFILMSALQVMPIIIMTSMMPILMPIVLLNL